MQILKLLLLRQRPHEMDSLQLFFTEINKVIDKNFYWIVLLINILKKLIKIFDIVNRAS
jgi:hypothetical protein